jgi:hypothetical protein
MLNLSEGHHDTPMSASAEHTATSTWPPHGRFDGLRNFVRYQCSYDTQRYHVVDAQSAGALSPKLRELGVECGWMFSRPLHDPLGRCCFPPLEHFFLKLQELHEEQVTTVTSLSTISSSLRDHEQMMDALRSHDVSIKHSQQVLAHWMVQHWLKDGWYAAWEDHCED